MNIGIHNDENQCHVSVVEASNGGQDFLNGLAFPNETVDAPALCFLFGDETEFVIGFSECLFSLILSRHLFICSQVSVVENQFVTHY